MKNRVLTSLVATLAIVAATSPPALADGLPVPVEDTFGEGVVAPDGASRFVSIGAGEKTVVMRVSLDGGEVADYAIVDGTYTIPAIAVDGTASGVSADGETLALISPRQTFPRKTTEFLVYEGDRLKKPSAIQLDGDFSYDALSPDGETLYLVEYTNPRDYDDYQVRAFDLETETLDPEPILDSEEDPDDMRGLPQTRVTSPDGRWEYTLYDGGGGEPFIHALDVVEGATVCIDLPMISPGKTYGAKLEIGDDGSSVELYDRKETMHAVVDGETLEAAEPGGEPVESDAAEANETSGIPAGLIAGGAALLSLGGVLVIRRSRSGTA